MYLKAVMTFEEKHIEEASAILGRACDTIGKFENIFLFFCFFLCLFDFF